MDVQLLWEQTARDSLNNILTEFDDLFMKHQVDIGRCKIANHTVEVEPGATPHREGARRMSREKAERANQEARNLALDMIQPSLSPWASGIVMVMKKNGALWFCCDFRPLIVVAIKYAYPHQRIDKSLSLACVRPRFTPVLIWPGLSGKYQYAKHTGRRQRLLAS